MRYFFHKYSSKFILYALSFVIILSCVRKHKFDTDKKQLSDNKMMAVLTDIFLMEAYVNEKMVGLNTDSLSIIKKSYYPAILKHHKADSADFYTTFSYFQAHPEKFIELLNLVDSNLIKIKPLDTGFVKPVVAETPKNIDKLLNFREQEEAMRKEYLKTHPSLQKLKLKNSENKQ